MSLHGQQHSASDIHGHKTGCYTNCRISFEYIYYTARCLLEMSWLHSKNTLLVTISDDTLRKQI